MSAGRDEIRVGQRQLAGRLRAIGEKKRSGLSNQRRDPIERLDHAGLVVCMLDREERRALGKDRRERGLVDQPIGADRNDRGIGAHGKGNNRMLSRSMAAAGDSRALRCDLDRFARATREDDVMTPAENVRDR